MLITFKETPLSPLTEGGYGFVMGVDNPVDNLLANCGYFKENFDFVE